jgi:hypothetical protein
VSCCSELPKCVDRKIFEVFLRRVIEIVLEYRDRTAIILNTSNEELRSDDMDTYSYPLATIIKGTGAFKGRNFGTYRKRQIQARFLH